MSRHKPIYPGLEPRTSRHVAMRLVTRKRSIRWCPPIVGIATFFAWMIAFGVSTDWLERFGIDVINTLVESGSLGIVAVIMIGYGGAFGSGVLASEFVQRRMLRRHARTYLETPLCIWCDYNLAGLEPLTTSVRCPECGHMSPVARSNADPQEPPPLA